MIVRTVKDFLDMSYQMNFPSFQRKGILKDVAWERINLIEKGFGLW
jgi:hypothetical protein